MRMFVKILLVVSGVLLVGCGGGSGSPIANAEDNTNATQAYQNKKLPVIKSDAIPDILLSSSTSLSPKRTKYSKEVGEVSSGFTTLKEKSKFFYKKQLEMNIELGYMDSIWSQIDSYCKEKNICNIPSEEIIFTYTKALYNRDMILIKEYEEKSGDANTYNEYKDGLKRLIGEKLKLSSTKLIIDESSEYKYVLSTEQLGEQEENPNIERSIVKWNDNNENYFIREEVEGTIDGKNSEKLDWTQFEYKEIGEEKVNIFVSKDNSLGYNNEHLEFREQEDESIYFIQDEPMEGMDEGSYYAEGYLKDNGGYLTVVGGGETYYEKFDEKGILLSTVKCLDIVKDINNIPENALCSINDPDLIKKYITKSVYSLGLGFGDEFGDVTSSVSESALASKNMIKFDDNNTLFAIIDCAKFTADYTISSNGISFSNIVRINLPDLKCIDSVNQDKFEQFLKVGYNKGYDVAFDFWPVFDNMGSALDFNMTKFYTSLDEGEFVNSPLMNSVFKIKSVTEYLNLQSGKNFLLKSSPSIKVEDKKIVIDLVDAIFNAEIIVVDSTHIKFTNINRVNKSNVIYPDDINLTCTEENAETENECIEDPYTDAINSDKIFAGIIKDFLKETIEVYSNATDYTQITFTGSALAFIGQIGSDTRDKR